MFTNLFEILTVAADLSQFLTLKKSLDNSNELNIISKLDKIDDEIYGQLLKNQIIIIKLLGGLFMEIKKMLDKILEKNNPVDMDYLGDTFIRLVYSLKETDKMHYKDIKFKMHKLAYGDHLTEEQAKCWVYSMENKDGTKGAHWTYEQTEHVRMQYAPDIDKCDWFAVLNMVWSDNYNSKYDDMMYIELAKNFIYDKDVTPDKTLKYYLFIAS